MDTAPVTDDELGELLLASLVQVMRLDRFPVAVDGAYVENGTSATVTTESGLRFRLGLELIDDGV